MSDPPLYKAADSGDIDEVRRLINAGADLYQTDIVCTYVHACAYESTSRVTYRIQRTDINICKIVDRHAPTLTFVVIMYPGWRRCYSSGRLQRIY